MRTLWVSDGNGASVRHLADSRSYTDTAMATRLSCECLCTNVDFGFNSTRFNAKLIQPLFVNSGVAREARNRPTFTICVILRCTLACTMIRKNLLWGSGRCVVGPDYSYDTELGRKIVPGGNE